jgi:hypothetical protein
VRFQGNGIGLTKNLVDEEWVGGHIDPSAERCFKLVNRKTKTAVEVRSTVDPGPFYIYIWRLAFCPEPMIEFDLQPGKSFSWSRTYTFTK